MERVITIKVTYKISDRECITSKEVARNLVQEWLEESGFFDDEYFEELEIDVCDS